MVKSKAAKAAKKAIQKPPKPRPSARVEDDNVAFFSDQLPICLQQSLLNIFSDACVTGSASDIEATLQEVKGHLYNRDFATAFGKDEYLRVYAARWSPSRALGYAQVFHDIENFLFDTYESASSRKPSCIVSRVANSNRDEKTNSTGEEASVTATTSDDSLAGADVLPTPNTQSRSKSDRKRTLKIACLGGGAGAEIVGLAGWLKSIDVNVESSPVLPVGPLEVLCLDIAQWDNVMKDLHEHCITPPILSKYASAAARDANVALTSPEALCFDFKQQDILDYSPAEINIHFSDTDLVTIMFTLNELYSASLSKAQRLLHNLTTSMKDGALLLVVDSPGSYSAVTINGAERKYPMQFLLDHTLLEVPSKASGLPQKVFWEKLVSDDSRWFRLQKEVLKYPIELENMRYQIHLYRRCEGRS